MKYFRGINRKDFNNLLYFENNNHPIFNTNFLSTTASN